MAKNRMEELMSRPLRTVEEAGLLDDTVPEVPIPPLRKGEDVWMGPPKSEPPEPPPAPPEPKAQRPAYSISSSQPQAEAEKPKGDGARQAVLSSNNQEKLDRLNEHFKRLFLLAQSGIVEGVKFYGDTIIRVSWQDGQAQSLHPTIASQDRVGK